MNKFIRISFSNGAEWGLPVEIIARDRAAYYAHNDTGQTEGEEYQEVYDTEYQITTDDEYEAIDWLRNNMDWEDIVYNLVFLRPPDEFNYEKAFSNAAFDTVTSKI